MEEVRRKNIKTQRSALYEAFYALIDEVFMSTNSGLREQWCNSFGPWATVGWVSGRKHSCEAVGIGIVIARRFEESFVEIDRYQGRTIRYVDQIGSYPDDLTILAVKPLDGCTFISHVRMVDLPERCTFCKQWPRDSGKRMKEDPIRIEDTYSDENGGIDQEDDVETS
ncbi:MAG: hypothetical protein LQ343_006828 [Gyalolechia ehrenbergii]|nr:MAG: hypothetical protein LQ343_006828 [Gyalolechia ehrenbergii]